MEKSSIQAALMALAVQIAQAALPTRSLSDCQAFAATFDNTCTGDGVTALSDLAGHAGSEVACTGTMRCPNGSGSQTYTSDNKCTWNRKLCVTCSDSSGEVMIKVQGNGLPNHCVNATVNNAVPLEVEWEVVWMPDVTNIDNYSTSQFDTEAKTSSLLCDLTGITSSSNMNSASNYSLLSSRRLLQGGPPPCPDGSLPEPGFDCEGNPVDGGGGDSGGAEALATASGIALSGGYIFNGLAGGDVDAVETEGDTLDVCLSHATPNGEYHYHIWNPCMVKDYGYWDDQEAMPLCRTDNDCLTKTGDFCRTSSKSGQSPYFTADTWDVPIGLARDGHLLLGPYKQDGSTWTCSDRDVCNGTFIEGTYVYVGSNTFPYVVGCWGPGPENQYEPSCTSNGCGEVTSLGEETGVTTTIASAAIIFSALTLLV